MAVVCSPAGVCVIDGLAAGVQATAPAPAHACCKSGEGTYLTAGDDSCCTEPRTGFVNVFRFAFHKQALPALLDFARGREPKTVAGDRVAFEQRAPLVLRI